MLINATLEAAIMGAMLGSILTWFLNYFTEKRKFNKKNNGSLVLLKSEIEMNINNLKKYDETYLSKTPQELKNNGNLNDIKSFYNSINQFPILSHSNWDKLTDTIPYIFENEKINQIIEFNAQLDQLNKYSELLSNINIRNKTFTGFYLYELDIEESKSTLGNYILFKAHVLKAIETGEKI